MHSQLEEAVKHAREAAAADKAMAAKAVGDATAGGVIAAAWWRKRVQMATVKAIMLDRKAEQYRTRAEEHEQAITRMADAAGGQAESEALEAVGNLER